MPITSNPEENKDEDIAENNDDLDIDDISDLQDGDAWGNNPDDCYLSDTIFEEDIEPEVN